jgi:hypothetical protein
MHKSATKCNKTQVNWCKNKHGASKIIDTLETYQQFPQLFDICSQQHLTVAEAAAWADILILGGG